ncbi:MAG: 2'-deoxycytidine 5'-triphosphate deaminase [Nitrospinaceae bacterium]
MASEDTRIGLKRELDKALRGRTGKLKNGYWPSQLIEMADHLGIIRKELPIEKGQYQPVSLDLRLGGKAYRIQSSFLPEKEKVETKLKDLKLYEVDLNREGILEKGAIYLVPLVEKLNLPKGVFGVTNPKSSTGRLDMFTRVIIDFGNRFDEIPSGYQGQLFLEIIPRSFPVKVQAGLSLNQLRLYQGDPYISDREFRKIYRAKPVLYNETGMPLAWGEFKYDEGLFVSLDLCGPKRNSVVAYKAKTNSEVIDLSKIRHYNPRDFWEPVKCHKKNRLILEPESFYIMMSKEKICIWPDLLAEMVAYEPNSGELRTHYAGFFDPGFGWHGGGDLIRQGTKAVMEVRPHDVPFQVEDGQTFCRLKFERTVEEPKKIYGKGIASNYHSQALKLSKHFKD